MAKANKPKTITLTPEQLEKIAKRKDLLDTLNATTRKYEITEAKIQDNFCHYVYQITSGIGIGDQHKVTGTGIIEDDLLKSFKKFNVHLAVIDGCFLHSKIEIDDIDKFHDHELTDLFTVTGFQMGGSIDKPSIKLTGNKYCSTAGGRMEIKTHKIVLDNISGYKWYNELLTAANDAQQEVALYKEGYYTAVAEEKDEDEDPAQASLNFEKQGENGVDHDKEFEGGRVK